MVKGLLENKKISKKSMNMINTWHEMLSVINGESLSPFENEINVFEVIVLVLIILQVSPSL